MTKSPYLWLAGVACGLGGALAGNALGSAPIIDRPTIGTFYQAHDDTAFAENTSDAILPNHYDLVTRAGTVPVAALADRGLYNQARYRAIYAPVDDNAGRYAQADFPNNEKQPRYQGEDGSVRIGDAPNQSEVAQVRAVIDDAESNPLVLATGPATVSRQGDAKLIDVRATLALR